jgi:hypothetical protein
VQGFFALRAVVEQVHAEAHVDGHFLEVFLVRVSVDDVVAHVEVAFQGVEGGGGEHFLEPGVGVGVAGGAVDVCVRGLVVVFGGGGEVGEGIGAGVEGRFVQVLLGCGRHCVSLVSISKVCWTWSLEVVGEKWLLIHYKYLDQHGGAETGLLSKAPLIASTGELHS